MLLLTEVELRTHGSRPRPRTQKKSEAKAKDSLSEDRPSRGQGQKCSRSRPRTKDTAASVLQKKKGLQKSFSDNLQLFGEARIFDRRPQPQITCNDVIKIFQTRNFSWNKDIVGWKIWNRCLSALNHDFAKRESKTNSWQVQISNFGDVLRKLVSLKRITDGGSGGGTVSRRRLWGSGGEAPPAGRYWAIFWKLF